MASLAVTVFILSNVRHVIKSDRTIIQINLALALLLLHVFTLVHDLALQNFRTCEMIAVLIHFFLLASGKFDHYMMQYDEAFATISSR